MARVYYVEPMSEPLRHTAATHVHVADHLSSSIK